MQTEKNELLKTVSVADKREESFYAEKIRWANSAMMKATEKKGKNERANKQFLKCKQRNVIFPFGSHSVSLSLPRSYRLH